jgi:peptide/nickel transport system ATP-binding protein/oligopeptide transport system ATP-binding protein
MMRPLLDVQNLTIELTTRDGVAPVIDDLSFSLNAGETLSFVGESGCGKSMTALALMGLLPANVGRIAAGIFSLKVRIWHRPAMPGCAKFVAMISL